MMSKNLNFKSEYIKNNKQSFLKISLSQTDEVIAYQVNMLNENKISGVMPINISSLDGERALNYDTTSMLTLKRFLKVREISRNQYIGLIQNIVDVFERLNEYMLNFNNLIYDLEYVFVDTRNYQLYFAYLPIRVEADYRIMLKEFLKEIVHDNAKVTKEGNDFVSRLMVLLRKDSLETTDLSNLLDELGSSDRDEIALIDEVENSDLVNEIKKEIEPLNKERATNTLIWSFINITILCIVSFSFEALLSYSGDLISLLGGIILIMVSVNYFVMKKLKPDFRSVVATRKNKEKNKKKVSKIKAKEVELSTNKYKELAPKTNFETTVLSSKGVHNPRLTRTDKVMEVYRLKKSSNLLGRQYDMCDIVISNSTVGRTHAEFIIKGNDVFVVDLNSKNGTYINDQLLSGNVETLIKHGDIIKFSTEEFEFLTN